MNHTRHASIFGVVTGLAIATLGASIAAHVAWMGYGESLVGDEFDWVIVFASWVTVAGAAFAAARLLGASSRLVVIVGTLAFPAALFAAIFAMLWSSCAGWGPYECPFDEIR